MFQTKEQDKSPEEQLTEVKIGNLHEKDFRVIIVRMIQDLGEWERYRLKNYKKCLTKK